MNEEILMLSGMFKRRKVYEKCDACYFTSVASFVEWENIKGLGACWSSRASA
jgi:hypothetical protein